MEQHELPSEGQEPAGSSNSSRELRLRRDIGLAGSVAVIAGIMVGSGIFVSPTGVLMGVNNSVGLSLVVWAGCGMVSFVGALCYCELGSCFSISGGDYNFLHTGYGPAMAFTYAWCSCLITRGTATAVSALTVGKYAVTPFYPDGCKPPVFFTKTIAASVLVGLSYLNWRGVRFAARLQQFLTVTKFLAMGAIVVGGVVRLCLGDPVGKENLSNAFQAEDLGGITVAGVGMAFYHGLWSFDGWSEITMVAEEIRDSHKTIPRALIVAVPLVTLFYVLVNASYFAVLTPDEMLASEAVAVTWASRVLGPVAWIMPVCVCLSTAGSLNGGIMSGGRLPFAAARRGHFPKIMAMAHIHYRTPVPSQMFMATTGLVYLFLNDIDALIVAFGFTAWVFYGLSVASILILRVRRPDMPRPFKVPLPVPILALVAVAYLLVAPLLERPDVMILYAIAFLLAAPVAYYVFVRRSVKLKCMDTITDVLQKLIQVYPTNWEDRK